MGKQAKRTRTHRFNPRMTISRIAFVLLLPLVLSGCFDSSNNAKTIKKPIAQEIPGIQLQLQDIRHAIARDGVELSPTEAKGWVLNNTAPNGYHILGATEKTAHPETVYIYLFDSEKARAAGLEAFKEESAKYDMMVPLIYEARNALVLYWHHADMNNGNPQTRFGGRIGEAMKLLGREGDYVGYIVSQDERKVLLAYSGKLTGTEVKELPEKELIERASPDAIWFSKQDIAGWSFQDREKVMIWFDGPVNESYPAQGGQIVKIIKWI